MIKTEKLTVKLLPDQKAILERLAEREGEAVAVVLRRIIRAEAQRAGLLSDEPKRAQHDPERQP